MTEQFKLAAKISTDSPAAVRPVLQAFVTQNHGALWEEGSEFQIEAELPGEIAKELNRSLLSSLRRVEKRTRLRAQWTHGTEVEHFFDYALKRKESA